ncbi:MAG TPA: protein kinase, partial [Polyangiaceae bacterium]|nr:protein kinase [Polyangiaceae bacterium]
AAVYEAFDETRGLAVAIKRLRPEGLHFQHAAPLFRQEYTTLAELAHPGIVRVYDYGLDEGVPYFVMELISGDSLRHLAPLAWREACSLLRDVASALALVHSRRLVHRDVTPRNVYRTRDGRAKLIDFGSLCAMGTSGEIVGTPPFISPESLEGEPIDARADLFALGALGYFLLTGKLAYPAAQIAELPQLWLEPLRPPSSFTAEVPSALDELVLSLLSTNPFARPVSAGEVSERLTALADLPASDVPEVAQAYLVTPSFVGREYVLRRFRRLLRRAALGRGVGVLLEGQSGVGRSRLLTHLLNEAKLDGVLALRANAKSFGQAFGPIRALAKQLYAMELELTRQAASDALLSTELDPLAAPAREIEAPDPERAPALIAAYAELFVQVGKKRRLALGVDDLDHSDASSIGVLARVSASAPSSGLLVLATSESPAKNPMLERFRAESRSLHVLPLRVDDTTALLSSIFGDVPFIAAISQWVHDLAEGNPRTALELAQQLVDQQVARLEHGRWRLPASLSGLTLPASVDHALDARVAALSTDARSLAEILALTSSTDPLAISEYAALSDTGDLDTIFRALHELIAASILRQSADSYVFAHERLKAAVERTIPERQRAPIHRRLALAYTSKTLTAYHFFRAGDKAQAFSTLREARGQQRASGRSAILRRSPEGIRLYDELLEWAVAQDLPASQLAWISRAILQLAAVSDERLSRHAGPILERL